MMVQKDSTCFVCGKPFSETVASHVVAGAPVGSQVLVDGPCFDRIVLIESERGCSQLEATLVLSARVGAALLGRSAQEVHHHGQ